MHPPPPRRCQEAGHLHLPAASCRGHSCWLVKKDLVSLQVGFTQSGQLRVSCVEQRSLDWRCEWTRSARACRTDGKDRQSEAGKLCAQQRKPLLWYEGREVRGFVLWFLRDL